MVSELLVGLINVVITIKDYDGIPFVCWFDLYLVVGFQGLCNCSHSGGLIAVDVMVVEGFSPFFPLSNQCKPHT